uniref:Uncharacterized protein n=1 Tax=Oryza glumipatula TaxID=40148 RepID=A0A0E0ANG0_9ORYZ
MQQKEEGGERAAPTVSASGVTPMATWYSKASLIAAAIFLVISLLSSATFANGGRSGRRLVRSYD